MPLRRVKEKRGPNRSPYLFNCGEELYMFSEMDTKLIFLEQLAAQGEADILSPG
jgi:hypothetical protein